MFKAKKLRRTGFSRSDAQIGTDISSATWAYIEKFARDVRKVGTKHWLRRAYKRRLLDPGMIGRIKLVLDELAPRLNAYLKSIGPASSEQRTNLDGQ